MIVSTVLVPCLEWGNGCRLDWQAISALGSCAAAGAAYWAAKTALNLASKERRERETKSRVDSLMARIAIGPHAERVRKDLIGLVSQFRYGPVPQRHAERSRMYEVGRAIDRELMEVKALRTDLQPRDATEISIAIALADELAGKTKSLGDTLTSVQFHEWDQATMKTLCEKGERAAGVFARFAKSANSAERICRRLANSGRRRT